MQQFEPKRVRQELGPMSAGNCHAPAANTAAVVILPAVADECHAITDGISYSYVGTGTLSGGNLTVTAGGITVFTMDVSAKGQDFVPFRQVAAPNTAVVVTLAQGGADVTGKVSLLGCVRMTTYIGAGSTGGELDFSDYADSGMLALI